MEGKVAFLKAVQREKEILFGGFTSTITAKLKENTRHSTLNFRKNAPSPDSLPTLPLHNYIISNNTTNIGPVGQSSGQSHLFLWEFSILLSITHFSPFSPPENSIPTLPTATCPVTFIASPVEPS
ncbi:hypothetical protein L596_025687 [Steinernema carpocapsae]|uniref:Uncharacterized protein n=1 Tax=Steinernema carpocapsae TaxID=34508 RepID=A0A4U5M8H1_STECR|nr:hypothetical protein L596_025687 [Steinernema carpocapsae]